MAALAAGAADAGASEEDSMEEDFLNKKYGDKTGSDIVTDAMNYTTKSNEFEISTEMDFVTFKEKYFNNCEVGDDDYDACIELHAYYIIEFYGTEEESSPDRNLVTGRSGERRQKLKKKLQDEISKKIDSNMEDGSYNNVTQRSNRRQLNLKQRKRRESFERALERLDELDKSSKRVIVPARHVRLRL